MQHTLSTSGALDIARRYWQTSLVRGVLAIIAGLVILLWPHLAYSLFFIIFGAFAIAEGLFLIANGYLQHRRGSAYQHASFDQSSAASPGGAYYQQTASTTSSTSATVPQSTPSKGDTTYQKSEAAKAAAAEQAATFEPDATLEETFNERIRRTARQDMAAEAGTSYQARAETPSMLDQAGTAIKQSVGEFLVAGSTIQIIAGVLSVICGILCLVLPVAVGALVVYAVAAWTMFIGISSLMQAPERGWVLGAVGVMALILSLFLFIDPIGAIRGFLWGVGLFALVMGVLLVARALQHNLAAAHEHPTPEPVY